MISDFIYKYYIDPIRYGEAYTIVDTLTYALILIISVYLVYRWLSKKQIAIDGTVASGKDTIGSRLAKLLDCFFIESGAIYRAAAWYLERQKADYEDQAQLLELLQDFELVLVNQIQQDKTIFSLYIDDKDIGNQLRSPQIDLASSQIARQPLVRQFLIDYKKALLPGYPRLIMTGRGIGRMVLPEADLKIYLTGSLLIRAQRRYEQILAAGGQADLEQVKLAMAERDRMNRERDFDPDQPTADAVILDTTKLSIEEVCEEVLGLLGKGIASQSF